MTALTLPPTNRFAVCGAAVHFSLAGRAHEGLAALRAASPGCWLRAAGQCVLSVHATGDGSGTLDLIASSNRTALVTNARLVPGGFAFALLERDAPEGLFTAGEAAPALVLLLPVRGELRALCVQFGRLDDAVTCATLMQAIHRGGLLFRERKEEEEQPRCTALPPPSVPYAEAEPEQQQPAELAWTGDVAEVLKALLGDPAAAGRSWFGPDFDAHVEQLAAQLGED
jgi:hypothetical protein